MLKAKQKILTVCHDAGGAEIVSAYAKKHLKQYNFVCLAVGPARTIFKRKGLGRYLVASQKKAQNIINKMGNRDLVLAGTSGKSLVEIQFIKYAKDKNIKTTSYLDHWVNYRERFGYPNKNWQKNLPNEIWVGDKYALSLVRKYFKDFKPRLVSNLYWREVKSEYEKIKNKYKQSQADNILFMSEPIVSSDILKKLLDYLVAKKIKNKLIICYHPAEAKDKYSQLLSRYNKKLHFGLPSQNRWEDFARAKLVLGMKSMILAVANLCGKITVSFIPDRADKCPLPFKAIIKIHDIKQLGKILC